MSPKAQKKPINWTSLKLKTITFQQESTEKVKDNTKEKRSTNHRCNNGHAKNSYSSMTKRRPN